MAISTHLCQNNEGWGPLSPTGRSDFTPCFIEAILVFISAWMVLLGGIDTFRLSRRAQFPVKKNWHYYTKLVVAGGIVLSVIVDIAYQIKYRRNVEDIRLLGPIIQAIAVAIAFTLHKLEHDRSRVPRGTLLFFWLFFSIVQGIKVRSLVVRKETHNHLSGFIVAAVIEALAVTLFGLELVIPKAKPEYALLGEDEEHICPLEDANIFSILTFGWMTGTMKLGYKKFLTEEDLWNLRKIDTAQDNGERFNQAWKKQLRRKKPSLWIALFSSFGWPYAVGGFYKIVQDILNYSQPQLLRLLISFVASYQTDSPQPVVRGAAIALSMFVLSVIQTFTLHQYFQHTYETGMRFKTAITSAIYKKSMVLSNEGRAAKTTGDIVNLQAVDAQRLQDVTTFGQQVWSSPFQIVLCMVSLYQLVGPAMFAGIGVMILMIPVNGLIARFMKKLQKRQMKNKDQRSRLMTEILSNMKSIKLYAWTSAFMDKLAHVRNDLELKTLRTIGITQSVSNFTWSTTPFMVSCATFTVFVLTQDKALTTEIVFPALTLFNMLSFPLAVLPMVISAIVEATVASERIVSFLTAEELQPDAVIRKDAVNRIGDETVSIKNGAFSWNKVDTERIVLQDINFSATKGELSCLVGRVGSGKSSFLQAILGDLWKISGEVVVRGKIAYVSQSAWITNATVRENIIFGHRFDPEFYQKTIRACALLDDFDALPDGDETEVGEKGISLSGGQKARVNLARAVYARADVYILDDPLSAVDQHVGRHIIDNVLGPSGLLAGKTRIMATNSIPVLREADYITLLVGGKIEEHGTFDRVLASRTGIYNILRHAKDNREETATDAEETLIATTQNSAGEPSSGSDDEQFVDLNGKAGAALKNRRASGATLRRASDASQIKGRKQYIVEDSTKRTHQGKEFSEQGKVKWSVYRQYAKTANVVAITFYFLALAASQSATIGSSVWLKIWSEDNAKNGGNANIWKYIGIYFLFGFGASALVMAQNLIIYILCSIRAARKLHDKMARAIFRAPMQFFDTTPAGRILNRFSSDIYRIDEVLARCFNQLFSNTAKCIGTFAIISVSTPPFLALIVPLTFIYLYIQRYYLRTSRELKRLDSVTKSPIYAHFQESLGGISTIRAYGHALRFEKENEERIDANLRAFFPSINANRWLAVRLEFIGSVVILAAAGLAIITLAAGHEISAGMVGLSMSFALQITGSLNWIVRQTVETENAIVSVERVLEYAALPSEAPEIVSDHRPAASWPSDGAVSFKNFSARYRPELDLILKDINIDVKPMEKIGIVGRTGAGKSSLTLALFRLIEPAEGHIDIDSVNTSKIGLTDLRQKLAIIPQDASLFEGTVRDNLDPRHEHDDTDLWNVLELAHLKDHVSSMEGKLEARINEGGSNLSAGQKQLVSLARALLTPSKILVIDEATASVDVETDATIQVTIREKFGDRTILTIAHRMNTIIDSDRCLVLQGGRVVEFDTPAALIAKEGSIFHSLAKEAGLTNED